jgi:hypothetical protein
MERVMGIEPKGPEFHDFDYQYLASTYSSECD